MFATLRETLTCDFAMRLLAWDVPGIMARRVVFLVVDTSDSFQNKGKELIPNFLAMLIKHMNPGDVCQLWLLGKDAPETNSEVSVPRHLMANRLRGAIKPIRGGSWLKDTIAGIAGDLKSLKPKDLPYLSIVTDGEIFDRDAVAKPALPPERVMVVGASDSEPQLWPGHRIVRVPAVTDEVMRNFLQFRLSVRLVLGNRGSDAVYRIQDKTYQLIDGDSVEVHPGESVRLCYVGGDRPSPEVRIELDGIRIPAPLECNITQVDDPQYIGILRSIKWKYPKWDFELLECLVSGQDGTFKCPGGACSLDLKKTRDARNPYCKRRAECCNRGMVLLAKNCLQGFPEHEFFLFPLDGERKLAGDPPLRLADIPEECEPCGTYDICNYKGNSYLVVRFEEVFE